MSLQIAGCHALLLVLYWSQAQSLTNTVAGWNFLRKLQKVNRKCRKFWHYMLTQYYVPAYITWIQSYFYLFIYLFKLSAPSNISNHKTEDTNTHESKTPSPNGTNKTTKIKTQSQKNRDVFLIKRVNQARLVKSSDCAGRLFHCVY